MRRYLSGHLRCPPRRAEAHPCLSPHPHLLSPRVLPPSPGRGHKAQAAMLAASHRRYEALLLFIGIRQGDSDERIGQMAERAFEYFDDGNPPEDHPGSYVCPFGGMVWGMGARFAPH